MGSRAIHGEPGESSNVGDLAAHEVENMGPHHMDAPTVPLLLGIGIQQVGVLVIAVHEQGGKPLEISVAVALSRCKNYSDVYCKSSGITDCDQKISE